MYVYLIALRRFLQLLTRKPLILIAKLSQLGQVHWKHK